MALLYLSCKNNYYVHIIPLGNATEKTYFGHCTKRSLGPEHVGQPGHNKLLCGSAAHHLLCANATMDTLGGWFKGTADPTFLCASSHSSGSCFCLPDWREIISFFFFFHYLSTSEPLGSVVWVGGRSRWEPELKQGKQQDKRGRGRKGARPLFLVAFSHYC